MTRAIRQVHEMAAMNVELARIGTLKTEDRLLFVAHSEQSARDLCRALAGEEFLCEFFQDRPLCGASVLGLVHQDMVDAVIELVEYPGRRTLLFQKRLGF